MKVRVAGIFITSTSKKVTIHDHDSPLDFLEFLTIHDSK